MEHNTPNKQEKSEDENKAGLTPRELILRHMKNPDDRITDEDINNLQLNANTASEQQSDSKTLSGEEIEKLEQRTVNPLDILGE